MLIATPAAAQTGDACIVAVNRSDARGHAEPGAALPVDAGGRLDVVVASLAEPITHATFDLEFSPATISLVDEAVTPQQQWARSFNVSDGATFGVGLYRGTATVRLSSGATCERTVWFEVTGRSPFATVAGVIAALVVVVGLALVVVGTMRATRRQGGLALAVIGGAATGAGALVLAQQSGAVPLEGDNALLWTVAPGAAAGLLQRGAGWLTERGEPRRADITVGDESVAIGGSTARPQRTAPVASAPPPAVGRRRGFSWSRRRRNGGEPPAASPAPRPTPAPQRSGPPLLPPIDLHPAGAPPAASEVAADPPRSAYARLDCPDAVVAGREFDLVVGLAEVADADVVGDVLVRPESSVGAYTLVVQLVAEGFELTAGESWRIQMPVTADAPYPAMTVHMTALPQSEPVKAKSIRAIFSVDGQTMGMAFRSVVVAASATLLQTAEVEPQDGGVDLSVPTTWTPPDVTVRILQGESSGRLLWTFETSCGVDVPSEPIPSDIGGEGEPREFARGLIDRVNVREGQPGLFRFLKGVGRAISEEMPEVFWTTLRAVADVVDGRPPTILILSEEPFIPWELAVVEPPLDASQPPFLNAQAIVGRWVLGHKLPKLPPPADANVASIAVIFGEYNRPGWSRLLQAEDEAAKLSQDYGAVAVKAAAGEVLGCLDGSPKADVLHFAVHGKYDPNGTQDGVVLTDGHVLDPFEIKGSSLQTRPFVFLNACQVGVGNKVLGDYAGLASAFLEAGASGVIAPLWSVNDELAKGIALRFYERAFAGASVGSVLRDERAAFKETEEQLSATYLAYQFFGHPSMKMTRMT
jgi:CHAT domain